MQFTPWFEHVIIANPTGMPDSGPTRSCQCLSQLDPRGIFLPSPIVHSVAGYVVYRLARRKSLEAWNKRIGPVSLFLIITLVFSILPDVDAIAGLLTGDFGKYHNNGTHSLVVGLLVAVTFGLAFSWKRRADFLPWFFLILISYSSHILLDFFTRGGRGVMLFWPFSTERFQSPLSLFFGVRWGDGLLSVNHLWTVGTEAIFILVVWLLFRLIAGSQGAEYEAAAHSQVEKEF